MQSFVQPLDKARAGDEYESGRWDIEFGLQQGCFHKPSILYPRAKDNEL